MAAPITRMSTVKARIKVCCGKQADDTEDESLVEFKPFWYLLCYAECPRIFDVQAKMLEVIKKLKQLEEPAGPDIVIDRLRYSATMALYDKITLSMWMDGCFLPPFESSHILRNEDSVTIIVDIPKAPIVYLKDATRTIQPNSDAENQKSHVLCSYNNHTSQPNGDRRAIPAQSLVGSFDRTVHSENNSGYERHSISDSGTQNDSSLKRSSNCSGLSPPKGHDLSEDHDNKKIRKTSWHKGHKSISRKIINSVANTLSTITKTTSPIENKLVKAKKIKSQDANDSLDSSNKPQSLGSSLMSAEIQALLHSKIEQLSNKASDEGQLQKKVKEDHDVPEICQGDQVKTKRKRHKLKKIKSKDANDSLDSSNKPQSLGSSSMTTEIQALLHNKIEQLSNKASDEGQLQKKVKEDHDVPEIFQGDQVKTKRKRHKLSDEDEQKEKEDADIPELSQGDQVQTKKRRRKHKKKHKLENNDDAEKQTKVLSAPPCYKLKLPVNQQPQNNRVVFDESDEETENKNFDVKHSSVSFVSEKLQESICTEPLISKVQPESKPVVSKSNCQANEEKSKLTQASESKDKTVNISQSTEQGELVTNSPDPVSTSFKLTNSLTNTLAALWQNGEKDVFETKTASPAKKESNGIAMRLNAIANGIPTQEKSQRSVGFSSDPGNKFLDFRDRSRLRHRQFVTPAGDAVGNDVNKFVPKVLGHGCMESPNSTRTVSASITTAKNKVAEQNTNPVAVVVQSPKSHASYTVTPVGYDFHRMPPIEGSPQKGDCIAFKMMELGEDYTPSLSDFKVGNVVSIDSKTGQIEIEPEDQEVKMKRTGRFEMDLDDSDNEHAEPMINTLYGLLQQVRLVQRQM